MKIDLSDIEPLRAFKSGCAHGTLLRELEAMRHRTKALRQILPDLVMVEALRPMARSIYVRLEVIDAQCGYIMDELMLKREPQHIAPDRVPEVVRDE